MPPKENSTSSVFDDKNGSAIIQIAQERYRQRNIEGYSLNHDDQHTDGALARAAAVYAMPNETRGYITWHVIYEIWPWGDGSFKPSPNDRIRELVKAGALIVAEIERLQRLSSTGESK